MMPLHRRKISRKTVGATLTLFGPDGKMAAVEVGPEDSSTSLTERLINICAAATVLRALRHCRFAPATFDKRAVREWNAQLDAGKPLTEKQAAVVWKLGHRYRRQLGRCMARACDRCRGQT